ncbi:hypothetical protein ACFS5L_33310 [Streptomyces phyllanthi]|uniref:Uncharacterized protein n=1 Tax=Streptomyces phyllanthi TaxID=1803180 RepID=A0A5N8W9Y2_9ACTN|nr:hypothetical protein [Streptomyces phyllanthi]MPY44300.1 hypothetical protein [Streptomyces phyllanthi]
MARIHKYVTAAALTAVLAGTSSVSYAVSQGKAAHDLRVHTVQAQSATAAKPGKPAKPRVVQPGEHVVAAPGFELWLTEEGKHWIVPDNPDPQFRSIVDGNIDPTQPGVSLQAEGSEDGHYYLSGLYYGGRGTASYVVVETKAGPVRGKLLELPGRPGWGVWYGITTVPEASGGDPDFLGAVTVFDTKGRVYAQLPR